MSGEVNWLAVVAAFALAFVAARTDDRLTRWALLAAALSMVLFTP